MSDTYKVIDRLRPDSWMGWTEIFEEGQQGELHLCIAQNDNQLCFTERTAEELRDVLNEWLGQFS